MTRYRPGDLVALLGTIAVVVGALFLVPNTANPSAHAGLYVVCGLLILGGLLLRIEGAILRSGRVAAPPDEEPARRPWHRDNHEL
jgi:hypothetical protein